MTRKLVDLFNSSCSRSVDSLTRLWLLRLLVPLGGHHGFIGNHGFHNDALAQVVGLASWLDSGSREFDGKQVRAALRAQHAKAEIARSTCMAPPDADREPGTAGIARRPDG